MPNSAPAARPACFWLYLAAAGVLLWVIASASARIRDDRRRSAIAAFSADLQPGASLSTPDAFQVRCGRADLIEQVGLSALLEYQRVNLRVMFESGKPITFRLDVVTRDNDMTHNFYKPISDEAAYGLLKCKAAGR